MLPFGKPAPAPEMPARPSFQPKPSPVPPKSLGGMFRESLFGSSRPVPKPEQKPQVKPQPKGLFGGGAGLQDWELRSKLRKQFGTAPEKVGGFSKPFYSSDVGKIDGLLKKYGAGKGGVYTPESIKRALGNMKKDKMYMQDYNKKKELEKHIKLFEGLEKK